MSYVASHRFVVTLLAIIVFIQAADVASTIMCLAQGLPEGNPAMAALVRGYGPMGLVAAKVGFTLAIGFSVVSVGGRWALAATVGSVVITGSAVVANLNMMGPGG